MKNLNLYSPLVAIALVISACADVAELDQSQTVSGNEMTNALFADMITPYPFGLPNLSDADYYRWNTIEDNEAREEAKSRSNQLTRDALRIAYSDFGARLPQELAPEELPQILETFRTASDKHSESPALFLAEQMFAMKLQENIFPDFTRQTDIARFKESNLSEYQLEALELITEVFVRNGNPNADMIALNLHHLNSHAESSKLNILANRAYNNAVSWHGDTITCDNCFSKEDAKTGALRAGIKDLEMFIN